MPRLLDLLDYISKPETQHLWILLDIKTGNDPDQVMRLIAEALDTVKAPPGRSWNDRIVVGVWTVSKSPLVGSQH